MGVVGDYFCDERFLVLVGEWWVARRLILGIMVQSINNHLGAYAKRRIASLILAYLPHHPFSTKTHCQITLHLRRVTLHLFRSSLRHGDRHFVGGAVPQASNQQRAPVWLQRRMEHRGHGGLRLLLLVGDSLLLTHLPLSQLLIFM